MGVLSGGAGGGRPGRVASVADLPLCAIDSIDLFLKDGASGSYQGHTSSFFSFGGQGNMGAAGQLAAANTWLEVLNVSGHGVLSALVLSQGSGASVESVRVTVDGVARELGVSPGTSARAVVGALVPAAAETTAGNGAAPVIGYGARGFDASGVSEMPKMHAGTLPAAAEAFAMGLPFVEYFAALKVEFKTSRAPVPDDTDRVLAVYGSLPGWV